MDNTDVPTFNTGTATPFLKVAFFDITNASVGTGSPSFHPVGKIIDGWQKVEGIVELPEGADYVAIQMGNEGGTLPTYWDDIRFSPFRSDLKSFVYDKDNYKLRAVLDENNFATIYSYDEKGNLFLVKKETPKGIETIKESREHLKEQN